MSSASPEPDTDALGEAIGRRVGRALEVVLSVLASAVFVVMWVYIAVAAFGNDTLLADTWAWLSGLDPVAAVVVWIALLPICVFLWAWQADLQPALMGLVLVGLAGWTMVAFSGVLKPAYRWLTRRTG